MATAVEMPKLGNTVEECLIAAWRKKKGDAVTEGDVIAEIETDKTNFEITAPTSGTLLDVFFEEGALVPVFMNLCVIGAPGEAVDAFRPTAATAQSNGSGAGDPARATVAPPGTPSPAPSPAAPVQYREPSTPSGPLSPRARRFAQEHNFQPQAVKGSGPGGRVLEADLRTLFFSTPRVSAAAQGRIADGYVARGEGSGIGGMIRTTDLGAPPVRVSSMRDRIAKRMRESLATTAQYTMTASANAAGLLAMRKTFKASPTLSGVTINDLVVFCTIRALEEAPELNAEFIDGRLYRHPDIHIGFACDTDRGLLVPVVRQSQRLSIGELSKRMKDLAAQASKGTIAVDDLSGGTFTVSNLGNLGIESFTPLLNPPQVAILGVNAIQLKAVRKKDGNIEFVDAIGLSLTCDHQVIDGAPGARFLGVIREKIENVELLCTT